ncbi:hypothetical protein DFH07DRAFT_780981 [Mycena maculata]|uniref:Uncharacterized protein n=1 Tax=Mycena maculata TaxID=230809 RepID=A0AAD7MU41_9AGAR|nr:hypothetical protein DFH07DRAFT_780981 [Mycena maculata]
MAQGLNSRVLSLWWAVFPSMLCGIPFVGRHSFQIGLYRPSLAAPASLHGTAGGHVLFSWQRFGISYLPPSPRVKIFPDEDFEFFRGHDAASCALAAKDVGTGGMRIPLNGGRLPVSHTTGGACWDITAPGHCSGEGKPFMPSTQMHRGVDVGLSARSTKYMGAERIGGRRNGTQRVLQSLHLILRLGSIPKPEARYLHTCTKGPKFPQGTQPVVPAQPLVYPA